MLGPLHVSAYSEFNSNVTIKSPRNVYSYSVYRLALVYGLAILLTFFTVVIGYLTIWTNGASYGSDFSTFLRLSRGEHIDEVITNDGRDGADPLPKSIAKAKIRVGITASRMASESNLNASKPGTRAEVVESTGMLERFFESQYTGTLSFNCFLGGYLVVFET
jgi:hypothetical protein